MSTLNVANITDGVTSVGTEYVVNGSAKAWGDCDIAGDITATGSLNVSSVADNGASGKQFNYTNTFANPALGGAGKANGIGSRSNVSGFIYCNSNTTAHYSVMYHNGSSYVDSQAQFLALGDLA